VHGLKATRFSAPTMIKNGEFRSTTAGRSGSFSCSRAFRLVWRGSLSCASATPSGKPFAGFDPARVARFGEPDVARLLGNEGIIRSRAKIDATIAGARIYEEMKRNGEDFSQFVWNLAGGNPIKNKTGQVPAKTPLSEEISAVLKKRGFKFVGPVIVYAWMQAAGMVNDHALRCFRRNATK
jgi:DNA-3-methyladenine glycosylase I